ncbi:hypothetical protein H4219_001250 [Mycoemilia scoparia]|uniref:Dopey N-terminal domain-containing protein n=1 Tax=Mycoemilia scoparia TaxID=417184 RepID=A0A9W8A0Q5_9FUNG|nr:hypothetical protein H4219_001250 [Mycoemilia scoparia]
MEIKNKPPHNAGELQTNSFTASETDLSLSTPSLQHRINEKTEGNEWADVSAFLTKLSRALEMYSQFEIVPHKETVSKRLAQCLNPALPTGVHQKALQLYQQIFEKIKNDQLIVDLPLYSFGLFPFLRNASLKVRPQLLKIFEKYYLPLGSKLRSCTKSFTIALLPGLEEERSETYERVVKMLDKVRENTEPSFFYQTLFLTIITNPELRLCAISYLSLRLKVIKTESDLEKYTGGDGGLMIRALAASLGDSKTLVIRATLDFMINQIPLQCSKILTKKNIVILMKSALQVVLRKDMSLNRRLYTWLLGSGESEAEHEIFFEKYTHESVTVAISELFSTGDAPMSSPLASDIEQLPFRIMIGLLDKQEIVQPILTDTFNAILAGLYAKGRISEGRNHITRPFVLQNSGSSASLLSPKLLQISRRFMEMLNPTFIWSQLIALLYPQSNSTDSEAVSFTEKLKKNMRKVQFFLQTFELSDDETLHVHLPAIFLGMLAIAQNIARNSEVSICDKKQLLPILTSMIVEVFGRIPTNIFSQRNPKSPRSGTSLEQDAIESPATEKLSSYDYIRSFYAIGSNSMVDSLDKNKNVTPDKVISPLAQNFAGLSMGEGASASDTVLLPNQLIIRVVHLCQALVSSLGEMFLAQFSESSDDSTVEAKSPSGLQASYEMVSSFEQLTLLLHKTTLYAVRLFGLSPSRLSNAGNSEGTSWITVLLECCSCGVQYQDGSAIAFRITNTALTTAIECTQLGVVPRTEVESQLESIVKGLWKYLSAKWLQYNKRAACLIYQLHCEWKDGRVEWILIAILNSTDQVGQPLSHNHGFDRGYGSKPMSLESDEDEFEKFVVFWTGIQDYAMRDISLSDDNGKVRPLAFTRLLLAIMDSIGAPNIPPPSLSTAKLATRHYNATRAISKLARMDVGCIVRPLLLLIIAENGIADSIDIEILPEERASLYTYSRKFEHSRVLYYIQTLYHFLSTSNGGPTYKWMSKQKVESVILKSIHGHAWGRVPPLATYFECFIRVLLRLGLTLDKASLHPDTQLKSSSPFIDSIQEASLETITLLIGPNSDATGRSSFFYEYQWPPQLLNEFQTTLAQHLLYHLKFTKNTRQVSRLLNILVCLLQNQAYQGSTPQPIASKNANITDEDFETLITTPVFVSLLVNGVSTVMHGSLLQRWCDLFRVCLNYLDRSISNASSYSASRILGVSFTRFVVPTLRAVIMQLHKYTRFFERFMMNPGISFAIDSSNYSVEDRMKSGIMVLDSTTSSNSSMVDHESSPDPLLPSALGPNCNVIDTIITLLDFVDLGLQFCLSKPKELIKLENNVLIVGKTSHSQGSAYGQKAANSDSASIPMFSYVTGIFGADTPASTNNSDSARNDSDGPLVGHYGQLSVLPLISTLLGAWNAFQITGSKIMSTNDLISSGADLHYPSSVYSSNFDGPMSYEMDALSVENNFNDMITKESYPILRRRVHARITKLLKHFQQQRPTELVEAMGKLWEEKNPDWWVSLHSSMSEFGGHSQNNGLGSLPISMSTLSGGSRNSWWSSELLDMIESVKPWGPVRISELLLELLQRRVSAAIQSSDGTGSGNSGSNNQTGISDSFSSNKISDIGLIRFTEMYIDERIDSQKQTMTEKEGQSGIESIQGLALSILRECCNNSQSLKYMLPFMLRLYTVICIKLAKLAREKSNSSYYSRDLFEAYTEIADHCILIAGRSFDQSSWIRRQLNSQNGGGGNDFEYHGVTATSLASDASQEFVIKQNADGKESSAQQKATNKRVARITENDIIEHILMYLRDPVLTQLGLLIPDVDSQTVLATNLMHYLVTPALKSHMTGGYYAPANTSATQSRHFMVILDILISLSKHTSLTRLWRREAWEFFNDPKFFQHQKLISKHTSDLSPISGKRGESPSHFNAFNSTFSYLEKWRFLIRSLVSSDKDKMADLLGRLSTSPMNALFTNRDQEALQRALSLRRVSFVIWAGDPNYYSTQIPQIQEKLVELIKNSAYHQVQVEIFLCLRVLLCRVSPHHLMGFWPVLITEVTHIFRTQINSTVSLISNGLAMDTDASEAGRKTRFGRDATLKNKINRQQMDVFLSACKFLDFLITMDTSGFLVHQWLFITDTIDALYGGQNSPYALIDILSSRLLSVPHHRRRRSSAVGSKKNGTIDFDDLDADALGDSLNYYVEASPNKIPTSAVVSTGQDTISSGLPLSKVHSIWSRFPNVYYNYHQFDASGDGGGTSLKPTTSVSSSSNPKFIAVDAPLKRPMIRLRSINSIRQLDDFIHNASLQQYQAAFTLAMPDLLFVDLLLKQDLGHQSYISHNVAPVSSIASSSTEYGMRSPRLGATDNPPRNDFANESGSFD